MATYNDYQKLADAVYDGLKSIISGKDANNNDIIWRMVEIGDGSSGSPKEYLEINNTSSGYYGAVYERTIKDNSGNETKEYVLANRGTQGTDINDLAADATMWLTDTIPAQYIGARELMKDTLAYFSQNNISADSLSIAGHSLGGSLSQMLAVEYGNESVTFNPFSIQKILDNMEGQNYDYSALQEQSTLLKEQLDQILSEGANSGQSQIINELLSQKQGIDAILNSKDLLAAYQPEGEYQNITNFIRTGDTVSMHYFEHPGSEIRITTIPSYFEQGKPVEFYQSYWLEYASKAPTDLTFTEHWLANFDVDKLKTKLDNQQDIYINLNGINADATLVDQFIQSFGDKNKFEIDELSGGLYRISSETELYFVAPNSAKKTDSTELIGELHEGDYVQSSFIKAGSKDEINELVTDLMNDSTNKDYTVNVKTEGNKVYLEYSRKETLNYVDSSNLALGGKSGSELVTGSNGNWLKVTELTANSAGYAKMGNNFADMGNQYR